MTDDAALLLLRSVPGGLLAGHGAQKVFGAFDGPGPEGTRGFMQMLRMRPAHIWGHLAGYSELVGGALTALGALSPIGPVMSMGPMIMATTTAHWGKPIWVTKGGAELPVINMSVFAALAMTGPGRFSVDNLLGIRLPRWVAGAAVAGVAAGTAAALLTREPAPAPQPEQAEPEVELTATPDRAATPEARERAEAQSSQA
ncbi:MAG TPA: DoxX family protein [Candidatus Dormibacteraeota bacterium]|jgi:putative oxidoreductase|nr:DoxX family protein [Candidatus Dormibacteraeota bacterium]